MEAVEPMVQRLSEESVVDFKGNTVVEEFSSFLKHESPRCMVIFCDGCAVERLQVEKDLKSRETFFDRVAQGGTEGFWLVGFVVLILVLIVMATGR